MSTAKTKRTVEDIVTQNIIDALEAGTVPWDKPWRVMPGFGAPGNVISKKPYRGINILLTGLQPLIEPWWITKRQARAAELRIKAEEFRKSTPIILWKPTERRCAQDEAGAAWSPELNAWVKRRIMVRFYDVWNVEQLEQYEGDGSLGGLIPPPPPEPFVEDLERTALEVFDDYLHREGIAFGLGAQGASYMPRTDAIALPNMASFKTVQGYIHTALHEGVHSTGHEKRLNRPSVMAPEFGTEPYAAEELVAEVGAAMLCAHLGIDPDIQRTSSYIDNWLGALNNDRKLIITAAQAAQKAADLIMFEPDDEEVTS